jgi:hypothetical protein
VLLDLDQYPVFLTDQYDHLGVNFETPWPGGWGAGGASSFVFDGLGAFGLSTVSEHDIVFSQPIQQFGMWDVAGSSVELFAGSTRVAIFAFATLEDGFFGFQSGEPFDRIRFLDAGGPLIDDMVFTPIIPGPGAAAVFALGFLRPGRRRR